MRHGKSAKLIAALLTAAMSMTAVPEASLLALAAEPAAEDITLPEADENQSATAEETASAAEAASALEAMPSENEAATVKSATADTATAETALAEEAAPATEDTAASKATAPAAEDALASDEAVAEKQPSDAGTENALTDSSDLFAAADVSSADVSSADASSDLIEDDNSAEAPLIADGIDNLSGLSEAEEVPAAKDDDKNIPWGLAVYVDEEKFTSENGFALVEVPLTGSVDLRVEVDEDHPKLVDDYVNATYSWYWSSDGDKSDLNNATNKLSLSMSDVIQYLKDNYELVCDIYTSEYGHELVTFDVSLDTGFYAYITSGLETTEGTWRVDPKGKSSITLTADASMDEDAPESDLSFEWYEEGNETSLSEAADFTIDGPVYGTKYYCDVYDDYGNEARLYVILGVEEDFEVENDDWITKYACTGDKVTLDPLSDEGIEKSSIYHFTWKVNEVTVSTASTYEFTMGSSDETLVACEITGGKGNSATITYDCYKAETLTTEKEETVTLNGEYTRNFLFTAPKDGTYSFYSATSDSATDPYGRLYSEDGEQIYSNDGGSEDDGWGDGYNFKIVADLEKGKTYRLEASLYDDFDQGTYYVGVMEGTEHTNHAYTIVSRDEPTCTEAGSVWNSCRICGTRKKVSTIPATGHKWGAWTVTRAATALAAGEQKAKCTVCGTETKQAIPKLPATISLTATSIPLKTKQKTTVISAFGLAPGDYVVSWTSSNVKAVKATPNGNSVILKAGKKYSKKTKKAVITAVLASGATASVTVKLQTKKVTTKKISVTCGKKLTLQKGQTVSIGAKLSPLTSVEKLKYSTSSKKVAKVSKSGVITAKKKGKATITVKSGKKTVKIKVTVK